MQTIYFSSARNRTLDLLERPRKGAFITLTAPSQKDIETFAAEHKLNVDLLLDAIDIYEAPRIELDGKDVYIYTRYCRPEGAEIATEPLLLIYTPDYLIAVSRLDSIVLKQLIAQSSSLMTTQKTKTLMQVLAHVNNSYRLQLRKVSKEILRFRAQLKRSDISNREFINIIELEEDLNEFSAALQPQLALLTLLTSGKYMRLYEDDRDFVEDLNLDVAELLEFTKSRLGALRNIRQVHDAIATNNLNRTFRRLTSITIFLAIPTLIAGVWGMNVTLPFANDAYAFWEVAGLAFFAVLATVVFFGRKRWL